MTEEFSLVGDLVDRERRSERPALYAAALDRTYSYFDLCNTAAKAGNVLSHVGVREGDRLVVDADHHPQAVFTFLGAALLGAVTEFASDIDPECDARAVVVPVEREGEFDLPGGSKLVAFGGDPDRPGTTHWEAEVWSENPAFPPTFHDPADPVLRGRVGDAVGDAAGDTAGDAGGDGTGDGGSDDARAYSHADLLAAAGEAVDALDLDADSRVAVRAPLSDPRAVAAGVLAPLVAGGAIALPNGDAPFDATATVVAARGGDDESVVLDVADVRL
ncbi:AMP-binding protein [Halobaculum magnesiiphilum]|uniref:AMP-binding protein n=1 Tax=Halobaculum magnesiiphilum TaxID=1017351 RepID=A0A8T8WEN3_9EURY|nr:AMP-binding protein [Halobaculum magnesiiphilum]QZP38329.1 AMP-binding protein [Halobaculum magnesiiphilum]